MFQAERYHDISCGHRVVGHEGKCRHLHGHNYRFHFTVETGILDEVGRVVDFSEIKSKLCMWLEENWDHRMVLWGEDKLMQEMCEAITPFTELGDNLYESIVWVPFNPTAENMAEYMVRVIGPNAFAGTGLVLTKCRVDETRKCSATYKL